MDPLTISGYVIAILIGFGSFRMKRGDVWKDEAEAHKARADRLEAELGSFRREFADYKSATEARIGRLETENAALRELATSHGAIVELAESIAVNHREIMTALNGSDD